MSKIKCHFWRTLLHDNVFIKLYRHWQSANVMNVNFPQMDRWLTIVFHYSTIFRSGQSGLLAYYGVNHSVTQLSYFSPTLYSAFTLEIYNLCRNSTVFIRPFSTCIHVFRPNSLQIASGCWSTLTSRNSRPIHTRDGETPCHSIDLCSTMLIPCAAKIAFVNDIKKIITFHI